ncbi:MAG: YitT family protein [Oscillospiraceae bacterium]
METKIKTKIDGKKLCIDIIYDIIGSYCYGLAVNMFTAANHIAPGGVAGFATLINYLTGMKIGMISFLVNVPLVIMAFMFLGKKFTFRTFKTVAIFTFIMDYGYPNITPYVKNPLMAALFAGALIGVGLGIILMRGSSTGGTDIIGLLIKRKMPYVSIAKLILLVDCSVLFMSVIVYKNIESAMLGLVTMFVASTVMDKVIYSGDKGVMMFIISDKSEQIGKEVINTVGRGATLIQAKGAFNGDERQMVLSAVRPSETARLREVVKAIDEKAFIMVTDATQIMGYGFKPVE